MSRIQRILERAEHDGAIAPAAPLAPPSAVMPPVERLRPAGTPPPADTPAAAAAPAPAPAPARRTVSGRLAPRLQAAIEPGSAAADQYRTIRTRLQHATSGPSAALLVTSPGRGEGKTQTAAGLGLTMAQEPERRTCIVDADLRHPQLGALFGVPPGPGLADVLAGRASLEEALVRLDDRGLTVLPAGSVDGHPAELLEAPAMRRVLQTLRASFDRIVVDAPGAASLADVSMLSPLVDGVMLVVRAGVTTTPAIHDALAALDARRFLGIVMNDVH